ncbi:hypothetical protein ACN3XK_31175 [Actinomadura welshii]
MTASPARPARRGIALVSRAVRTERAVRGCNRMRRRGVERM